MKLTMFGTGRAVVTECYNTCFLLDHDGRLLLVDGGGGIRIIHQIKEAGYSLTDIHEVFLTHKHIDHLLGIIWVVRAIAQSMRGGKYTGDAFFYGHDEVIDLLHSICLQLLDGKQLSYLDTRIHFVKVEDGETRSVIDHPMTFFDIGSTKAKQYGFSMILEDGRKLVCCGDEPCSESGKVYAKGADWMLHEAFCLFSEADKYGPYEKHHSTVKDACALAEELGVKNLLLYHTEDDHIHERKELYGAEGRPFFHGRLIIPDDMESIDL